MKIFALLGLALILTFEFIPTLVFGQTGTQNSYVSTVDQDLAIKSIVLLPVTDNVDGIYAKPVQEELAELLDNDKQWSRTNLPADQVAVFSRSELPPTNVQKALVATGAQALLQTRLIKGPRGLSISMTLYVGREGKPFLQESLNDYKGFETSEVRQESRRLFESLKFRMPFRANILSRRGQEVTLNLGSSYGLKPDSHVSVVQVVKVNRHPKLQFMVGTEKEVLGRVKLFKVEPHLSFGHIEMEREMGVITPGAKVVPDEFVKYAMPVTTPSGKILQSITTSPDKELAFGENPKEWLPSMPPQFGKVDLMAGLGNYTQNSTLDSSSISGSNNLAPHILVRGELWLDPQWFISANLRQSVFSVSNDLQNSNPGSLSMAMSQYGVQLGYNFILTPDYFGPKLQVTGGYLNTNFNIDDSSPTAFTSMRYGGMVLGLAGQFPISEEIPVDIGGRLDFFLTSSLSENKSSGSPSNTINSFSFFADYKLKTRFKVRAEILIENYNSSFSGSGERGQDVDSTSHKMTTLFGGVQYLF